MNLKRIFTFDEINSDLQDEFVFTHNAYFHREVTYPHADRYEFVSFYLIRKTDNRSSVRLCDKKDPDEPTARINVNPVKH